MQAPHAHDFAQFPPQTRLPDGPRVRHPARRPPRRLRQPWRQWHGHRRDPPPCAGADRTARTVLGRTSEQLAKATTGLAGVEIGSAGDTGFRVQIPVADGFASGSPAIRPTLGRALDALAPALAAEAGVAVRVVGHTDSQGSEMVNLRLSIARAEAVVAWLRERGIALDRLAADGRGEADPLTSNATEEGRVRNRRIELILSRMP